MEIKIEGDKGRVVRVGGAVFESPIRGSVDAMINVLGVVDPEEGSTQWALAGSGHCCQGHLYVMNMVEVTGRQVIELAQVILLDTNVMDIIPVVVDYDRAGFSGPRGVLAVGVGCEGSGVRIVDILKGRVRSVITTEQWPTHYGGGRAAPRLSVNDGEILAVNGVINERGWVSGETYPLNSLLEEVGVKIPETLEQISGFVRVYDEWITR